MSKTNFLTIKEFAELCQVHPKSLRYYDSLGILKPDYIDPHNGYRYYSISQMELVFAIQQLIKVGIPIKNLTQYISSSENKIHWGKIVTDSISILEYEIFQKQVLLSNLKELNDYFNFYDKIDKKTYHFTTLEDLLCVAIPYEGTRNTEEWDLALKKLLTYVHQNDLILGSYIGIIRQKEINKWNQFLFASVDSLPEKDFKQLTKIVLPSGDYVCTLTEKSGLEKMQDWILQNSDLENIEQLIEVEACFSDYHYSTPILEQSFLLKNEVHSNKGD